MKSIRLPAALLIMSLLGYIMIFPLFHKARNEMRLGEIKGINLPPFVVKVLSLEFQSLAADMFFVRASQFYGGRVESSQAATSADWTWLYTNLWIATDLDPYFEDPYYMGNAFLAWDAGMYKQANRLLQKGTDARTWDWTMPFFIGFNNFYFLGDNKGGADYLLKAYERPNAWPLLPNLAARLYSNEGKTEVALAFLINFWEQETRADFKKTYEVRIDALRKILVLEKAVVRYKEKTGSLPKEPEQLVNERLIDEVPEDPYGGTFYIGNDGSVKTTSNLAFKTQEKK